MMANTTLPGWFRMDNGTADHVVVRRAALLWPSGKPCGLAICKDLFGVLKPPGGRRCKRCLRLARRMGELVEDRK